MFAHASLNPSTSQLPASQEERPSTLSGKDFYLGPYGSEESRTEYDRLLAEWLANGRCWPEEPVPEPEAPYSIIRLCAEYLDFAEVCYRKDGQPTTSLFRVKVTLRIMATKYGREPASDFGPLKLRAIQQW